MVNQVSLKMAEGGDDYDSLLSRMDKLQSAIDAIEGWELDRQLDRAMDALRCPPGKPTCPHQALHTCGIQKRATMCNERFGARPTCSRQMLIKQGVTCVWLQRQTVDHT